MGRRYPQRARDRALLLVPRPSSLDPEDCRRGRERREAKQERRRKSKKASGGAQNTKAEGLAALAQRLRAARRAPRSGRSAVSPPLGFRAASLVAPRARTAPLVPPLDAMRCVLMRSSAARRHRALLLPRPPRRASRRRGSGGGEEEPGERTGVLAAGVLRGIAARGSRAPSGVPRTECRLGRVWPLPLPDVQPDVFSCVAADRVLFGA